MELHGESNSQHNKISNITAIKQNFLNLRSHEVQPQHIVAGLFNFLSRYDQCIFIEKVELKFALTPTYLVNIQSSKITDTDKAYQSFSKKT
jgi:hypothetical protein